MSQKAISFFKRWGFESKVCLAFTLRYFSWNRDTRRKLESILYKQKQNSNKNVLWHMHTSLISEPLLCFNYQMLSTYQFPPLLSRSGFPQSVHVTTDGDLPPNSRFRLLSKPSFWMHDQHPIRC